MKHIREVESVISSLRDGGTIQEASVNTIDLGMGIAEARLTLPRELFYQTLSEQSGFTVTDDGDLMSLLTRLAGVKKEHALRQVLAAAKKP